MHWTGDSSWYLIETFESFNGQRYAYGLGTFSEWFSSGVFGGSDYSNTPIGAVSTPDEPGVGASNPQTYFGLWAGGKNFGICAWASRRTQEFQATGDPFIMK